VEIIELGLVRVIAGGYCLASDELGQFFGILPCAVGLLLLKLGDRVFGRLAHKGADDAHGKQSHYGGYDT
jgi:hypothetical protein